jgi:N-alpha-acetyltransferase 15/16, NatA auxiliary subunit
VQGEIYQASGKYAQAQAAYRELIAIVPDNYNYHKGLCKALALPEEATPTADTVQRLKKVYGELEAKLPECDAVKRIALDFLSGDDFAAAAAARIRSFVERGIPSLFSDLKPLMEKRGSKADALWAAAEGVLDVVGEGSSGAIWVHLYLARHAAEARTMREAIDHITAAEASEALAEAGAALDVLSAKADILSAAGDVPGAAAAAEAARLLDLKDRYVNSMAAKYWFRAGDVQRATDTALLFAVDLDGAASNLNEMQVIWYELEAGCAHAAIRDLGMVRSLLFGMQLVPTPNALCSLCEVEGGHDCAGSVVKSSQSQSQHVTPTAIREHAGTQDVHRGRRALCGVRGGPVRLPQLLPAQGDDARLRRHAAHGGQALSARGVW